MTSKTFKSEYGRSLTIEPSDGHNIGLATTGRYLALKIEDAPALALAILEAAGVPWNVATALGRAAVELDKHVTTEAKRTAEARERAELEAEALELCNAYRKSFLHCAPEDGFDGFDDPDGIKAKWLAVARRARELAKEATK